MSVQSEIQRIQQAKADILSAIAQKNIIVPPEATLADAAGLITQIENSTTNNLFWQELISHEICPNLSTYTNDLRFISELSFGMRCFDESINDYLYMYTLGYPYVAVNGNTIINTGEWSSSFYDISTDGGMTWENYQYIKELEDTGDNIAKCFVFKSKFYITTYSHCIYCSTDGFNWERTMNDGFWVEHYCVTPNYVVTITSNDEVYYSTDGQVWIKVEAEYSAEWHLYGVKYDGQFFYLLGANLFYYSEDLLNWTKVIVHEDDSEGRWIVSDINHFYWKGGGNGWIVGDYTGLYWCTDITQTDRYDFQQYLSEPVLKIASRQGRALIMSQYKIYTSTDLVEWDDCTPTNRGKIDYSVADLSCDGTSFYIVGPGLIKAT